MYHIYRYYDERGRLLYVGITTDFERRDREHRLSFRYRWHSDVSRSDVQPLGTLARSEAEVIEAGIIKTEKPLHNNTHYKARMTRHQKEKLLRAVGGVRSSFLPIEANLIQITLGRGAETFPLELELIDADDNLYKWK